MAIMLNTKKFRKYILEQKTTTNKTKKIKPLETILCKSMAEAPLRLQAEILKLGGYDSKKVEYLPGKKQDLKERKKKNKEK